MASGEHRARSRDAADGAERCWRCELRQKRRVRREVRDGRRRGRSGKPRRGRALEPGAEAPSRRRGAELSEGARSDSRRAAADVAEVAVELRRLCSCACAGPELSTRRERVQRCSGSVAGTVRQESSVAAMPRLSCSRLPNSPSARTLAVLRCTASASLMMAGLCFIAPRQDAAIIGASCRRVSTLRCAALRQRGAGPDLAALQRAAAMPPSLPNCKHRPRCLLTASSPQPR
jgi:hypothetical protein